MTVCATLNSSAFVIVTGNGIELSEDLARRFIVVEFDAGTEHPEARRFTNDIMREVSSRRSELLADLLTIWRWGRISSDLNRGRPLGSYAEWCLWVRDPLLSLGCRDPAERVIETKENDSERQLIGELFHTWKEKHGDQPVKATELHPDVKQIIDPFNRGRQHIVAFLNKRKTTRQNGFVLRCQKADGKWTAGTYALEKVHDAP